MAVIRRTRREDIFVVQRVKSAFLTFFDDDGVLVWGLWMRGAVRGCTNLADGGGVAVWIHGGGDDEIGGGWGSGKQTQTWDDGLGCRD